MTGSDPVDEVQTGRGESEDDLAAIGLAGPSLDQAPFYQTVDAVGDRTGRDHGLLHQIAGTQFVGLAAPSQRGEDVVHPVLDVVQGEIGCEAAVDETGKTGDATDDRHWRDVELGSLVIPLIHDPIDDVSDCHLPQHTESVIAKKLHVKLLNMKRPSLGSPGASAVALATLLAPISWGTTYVTITELLPPDRPLLVAAVRVLPAGMLLTGFGVWSARWWPRGRQWLHLTVLAMFNFGLFFPLLIVGIYRLPGGVAASVGGVQPLLVALMSWIMRRERPRPRDLWLGLIAAAGVGLVVVRPDAGIDAIGVLAALGANVSFAVGVVLTRTLPTPPHRVAATGWQLAMASMAIAPLALVLEGRPPSLGPTELAGFAYLSLIATGAAFVLWFNGIQRLPTQAPPVLGLAAPLTGAALGWVLLGEDLTVLQMLGFGVTVGAIVYAATVGARSGEGVPRAPAARTSRYRSGALTFGLYGHTLGAEMSKARIKATYSLDEATIRVLERLARRLKVSKSEVVRRAIDQMARQDPASPHMEEKALNLLQERLGLTTRKADEWESQVRTERLAAGLE